jgi:hypothetical protein
MPKPSRAENRPFSADVSVRARGFWRPAARWLAVFTLLLGVGQGLSAETALSEYQVKALFLFNFAKYVEWPAQAFASANTPITIGIVGESKYAAQLSKIVEGKNISGRSIVIRQLENQDEPGACHILFISNSEKRRVGDLLAMVKTRPVLTVSDIDQFAQQGGIVGFVKKDDKIRLEIDLGAARLANLELSSKLLSVADTVRGKQ